MTRKLFLKEEKWIQYALSGIKSNPYEKEPDYCLLEWYQDHLHKTRKIGLPQNKKC